MKKYLPIFLLLLATISSCDNGIQGLSELSNEDTSSRSISNWSELNPASNFEMEQLDSYYSGMEWRERWIVINYGEIYEGSKKRYHISVTGMDYPRFLGDPEPKTYFFDEPWDFEKIEITFAESFDYHNPNILPGNDRNYLRYQTDLVDLNYNFDIGRLKVKVDYLINGSFNRDYTKTLIDNAPAIEPELNEHYYGDFNGDGITDVFKKGYDAYRALYISDGTSYSEVFFGDEDGLGGTDSETFFTSKDAIIYPGDYNGDGKSDLFVKGYGTYRALYLSLGTSFDRVFLGTKDAVGGTDSETFFTSKDSIIYPGDYNGDGKSDLFVKGYGTYRALYLSLGTSFDRVFLGTKDAVGGTDSETFFTSKDSIIYPDDYNNDGKTDLLVKGYGAYEALYLSQGTWFLRSYLKK